MINGFCHLKDKQRQLRVNFSENLGLRVHRALSWLQKSEGAEADQDSQFIFLWISFNAAYAQDNDVLGYTESKTFSLFVSKLVELDKSNTFYNLVWSQFSSNIRVLLDNQYVFQPFWDYQNGKLSEEEWKQRFAAAKTAANVALSNKRTDVVITIILQRLYTLRNQLVHGGATWNSSANRSQIRDGVAFLSQLVPIIINTMMDNPEHLLGKANFPLINN